MLDSTILEIDAVPYNHEQEQFQEEFVIREINKAIAGFGFNEDQRIVLTGKWGCGVFNGNVQLKLLIQWIAASYCKKEMCFFSMGDNHIKQVDDIKKKFFGRSIGKLVYLVLDYWKYTRKMDLFTYLLRYCEH